MIDAAVYRRVLGHYPTGVCVVTASLPDERRAGMVVGPFTSLSPPLVGFFPDVLSSSWPNIARAGEFCVNIFASDQRDLCRRFSAQGR